MKFLRFENPFGITSLERLGARLSAASGDIKAQIALARPRCCADIMAAVDTLFEQGRISGVWTYPALSFWLVDDTKLHFETLIAPPLDYVPNAKTAHERWDGYARCIRHRSGIIVVQT